MLWFDQINAGVPELGCSNNDNNQRVTTTVNTDYISYAQADTLGGLFQQRLRRSPDATAYIEYDREQQRWIKYSWRETAAEVARWQAALQREKLKPGDRIALMLRNCRHWSIYDLAAQGLGLVIVPIYTNDRPENIGYILQDAGVKLLLLENHEQWQSLQQIQHQLAGLARIVTLQMVESEIPQPRLLHLDAWLPATAGEYQAVDLDTNALATIVYTSGTTGRPKGVMLSHRNILWDIEAGLKLIDVFSNDLFLSFLPLSHALERTVGYYLPIVAGSRVAYARSIPELAEDLQQLRPTVLIAVPRIFERIYNKLMSALDEGPTLKRKLFESAVQTGWRNFNYQQGRAHWSPRLLSWPLLERLVAKKLQQRLGGRLRIAVSGGAPLTAEIARTFVGLGVPILQGYGLTETSPIIAENTHADNIPDSVGLILPGIEARIGENDELQVRSPTVMLGYWNNPQATAETIDPDGWLHTGDKVKIEQNHLFITGRIKEIIVLANGEKVPPADMEMCIALDPLFEQVLVIGEGRPYLSAMVVLNTKQCEHEGIDIENLSVDGALNKRLLERISSHLGSFPGYAQIRRLAVIDEPWTVENSLLTPTLKARRHRIIERYSDQLEALYTRHS
ncbi:AMP-dependent synthetase/ligase [endosymbiont of Ridgeia piscesae]|jgi:long-chain acyl-CoA synthetase|uniref:Long-chain acyl-CoA synthetase n=1 Tax=endosymbiont of Ridgeia piscesae TaxID=54398 RepID=A0A0T5Z4W8_9GAMM|nr:long-chain fatty acid--CoA ligase [endosymbiont of Ridgeia piscesae]KRT55424.1 Long-chain acyl-CoA synthetase (AMP-forming) [endosymbiont of Ridgeia piscesae]KRT57880.1 long-chain acyl-CoA synthetase [endosymbiont of Ridgeia piscesae]